MGSAGNRKVLFSNHRCQHWVVISRLSRVERAGDALAGTVRHRATQLGE
jgi:hypothetical protein